MAERMDQYNSGKMLTYPFPNSVFSPMWEVSANIRLGGRGGQLPRILNDSERISK